jgi:ribonuclease BN (tRNA processing enzyme)
LRGSGLEIIFIGTSSGKTNLNRYHCTLLLQTENHKMLIDAGDSVSRALITAGIDYNIIDSIFLTHYHADHFGGIASLITQMKLNNRSRDLKIFTHKVLVTGLNSYLTSCYLFAEALDFNLMIIPFEFDGKIEAAESFSVTARQNRHIHNKYYLADSSNVYFISSSLLIEQGDRKIFYTSDTGAKEDLYLFPKEKIDLLITETTHLQLEDIYTAYKKIKPKKLLLTHIDSSDEIKISGWFSKLNLRDQKKIELTYDGFKIEL